MCKKGLRLVTVSNCPATCRASAIFGVNLTESWLRMKRAESANSERRCRSGRRWRATRTLITIIIIIVLHLIPLCAPLWRAKDRLG
jgi:hypothetical protein